MPIYTVENKKTKKEKEVIMPYSEKEQWLKDNPGWHFIICLLYTSPSPRDRG